MQSMLSLSRLPGYGTNAQDITSRSVRFVPVTDVDERNMPASFRKQYTSCDQCRKSRMGCDAAVASGPSCSNCIRRCKTCTFEWIQAKGGAGKQRHERSRRALSTATTSTVTTLASPDRPAEAQAAQLPPGEALGSFNLQPDKAGLSYS